jgi:outer membrane protein assembly factor BamE (lipoprotein component of BamABCDE complex)
MEIEMKALKIPAVIVVCLAGLAGCAPMQTYDEMHTRGWTHESIAQRFPAGTSKQVVIQKLGSPFAERSAGDMTRLDYVGGASSLQHVAFYFKNGALVQNQFVNF